jgi:putative hemolysin
VSSLPGLLGVLFLLAVLLAGIAGASQASLRHINRARLRQMVDEGTSRAGAMATVLEEPSPLFSGIALLETLSIGIATLSGAGIVIALWPIGPPLSVLAGILLLLLILVVQVTARSLAMHFPESTALRLMGPVVLLARIFWPLLAPLLAFERWLLRLIGVSRVSDTPAAAEEDLRMLVEHEDGVLEEGEREMIQSIFEMNDRPVRELMVPRPDVAALAQTGSVNDAVDLALRTGYSRLPVYDGNLDNVAGVLVVKDLLRHLKDGSGDAPVTALLRPPYFVPETKKIDELLREMQAKRVHLAIVVDEYGGSAGVITLEDLVEEIVGEIRDEYDTEEPLYERIDDDKVVFDARASIHDVNEILHLTLDDEEFDTLGGLVYDQLGKVPEVGDEVRVDGISVEVLSTEGRRVKKVLVKVGAAVAPAAGESTE